MQRLVCGIPAAQTQLFQQKLANMAGDIVSAQLLSLHYSRLDEVNQLSPLQARCLLLQAPACSGTLELCLLVAT